MIPVPLRVPHIQNLLAVCSFILSKIYKSVENFFFPDNKHNALEVLELRPFRPAFDSQHFEVAFTCYYRSSNRLLVQFIESKMPALVYLSFKPWVNPQKFLWKEEALWLPSVDELINVFSLHQLEFVSFWLDYFPTYYEIRTFAKAPKQCWATRSPQLKHTDHIPQHMFVPIRYQNRPIWISPHWTRFGVLGSTPPSVGKKSYRRAVLAIRLWPKAGCKTYSPKNLIGNR